MHLPWSRILRAAELSAPLIQPPAPRDWISNGYWLAKCAGRWPLAGLANIQTSWDATIEKALCAAYEPVTVVRREPIVLPHGCSPMACLYLGADGGGPLTALNEDFWPLLAGLRLVRKLDATIRSTAKNEFFDSLLIEASLPIAGLSRSGEVLAVVLPWAPPSRWNPPYLPTPTNDPTATEETTL